MNLKTSTMITGLILVMVVGLGGCGIADKPITTNTAPDYSSSACWSIQSVDSDKPIDVFFMHPTTYDTTSDGFNASLTNETVNRETDADVLSQASVFDQDCNIYAPRYRQMSIEVLSMDEGEKDRYLSVAIDDMLAAFTYYLENLNDGRPYILASHSQGSNVTLEFLRKHRHLVDTDKLVAAYTIGWTITDEDLKQIDLPLAVMPTQTGGIITWNTIGQGGESPTLFPGARCINPLSWTATTDNQPAELNLGAIIELTDGTIDTIDHFTSACINEQGALVIPTPAIVDDLSMSMGEEVYHRYDYAFFYNNLVENVAARCNAWLHKK